MSPQNISSLNLSATKLITTKLIITKLIKLQNLSNNKTYKNKSYQLQNVSNSKLINKIHKSKFSNHGNVPTIFLKFANFKRKFGELCFPDPFWVDMVMKEDSSGVGVPGHQIRVNLDKSEGHRTERLKVFKKNKFCSYFNKF